MGNSAGIGFPGMLFIVFLVLKLTDVIAWSWWWVTAPVWVTTILMLWVMLVTFSILFGKLLKDTFFTKKGK